MKKRPERTCIICNRPNEKQNLLRIVKSKENIVSVDLSGNMPGRGAYICKNEDCIEKMIKTNKLSKSLKTEIQTEVYEKIREVIGIEKK